MVRRHGESTTGHWFLVFGRAFRRAVQEKQERVEPPMNRAFLLLTYLTLAAGLVASFAPDVAAQGHRDGLTPYPDWSYVEYGTDPGAAGLLVSPMGSTMEIILGAGNGSRLGGISGCWMILRHDRHTGSYVQAFVSPLNRPPVTALAAADLLPPTGPEIAVAFENGEVEIWNQASRTRLRTFTTLSATLDHLGVVDVDGDQVPDLVMCNKESLWVYGIDGKLKKCRLDIGGIQLVVGEMDGDSTPEIALLRKAVSGHTIEVLDAATLRFEWSVTNSWGERLVGGDVDQDGKLELFYMVYDVYAYDVGVTQPKYCLQLPSPAEALVIADVDGDHVPEIVTGPDRYGNVMAHDATTLQLKWSITNAANGCISIACGDVDQDNRIETIWTGDGFLYEEHQVHVADGASNTVEWSSESLGGPFRGPVLGDVDGDAIGDLVTASYQSRSSFRGGRVVVFDAVTTGLKALSPSLHPGAALEIHQIALHDVDNDPAQEILVAGLAGLRGTALVLDFDGTNFTTLFVNPHPRPYNDFTSITAADLDGDHQPELIAGGKMFLYVYDLKTGTLKWQPPVYVGWQVLEIVVANTDLDPHPEILAIGTEGNLIILDGTTHKLEAIIPGSFSALATLSLGSRDLILLGDPDGKIWVYDFDGQNYVTPGGGFVSDKKIEGITFMPPFLFFVGAGETVTGFLGAKPFWQTIPLGYGAGKRMVYLPFANLGVTAARYGLFGFRP